MLVGLGIVHFGCIGLLWWLPRAAGGTTARVRARAAPGLVPDAARCFRVFLPVTYVVLATLGPFFPKAVDSFGVADAWRTPVVGARVDDRPRVLLRALRAATFGTGGTVGARRWGGCC
ncbi:MAG: hypothetical protein R3B49_09370 [Phycisphaerales bacterium]